MNLFRLCLGLQSQIVYFIKWVGHFVEIFTTACLHLNFDWCFRCIECPQFLHPTCYQRTTITSHSPNSQPLKLHWLPQAALMSPFVSHFCTFFQPWFTIMQLQLMVHKRKESPPSLKSGPTWGGIAARTPPSIIRQGWAKETLQQGGCSAAHGLTASARQKWTNLGHFSEPPPADIVREASQENKFEPKSDKYLSFLWASNYMWCSKNFDVNTVYTNHTFRSWSQSIELKTPSV